MKSRLSELDAIRGLAALAVVIFHYFYHYNIQYGHPSLNVGWSVIGKSGVELFFMVSGFVIFMTLNRTEKAGDFIVSRLSRLFPAYWAAIILTFTVVSIFGLPGREVSAVDAAINFSMIQQLIGTPNVDGVYWTLLVEFIFYCLMLLLYSTGKLNNAEPLLIAFICYGIYAALAIDNRNEASVEYLFPRNAAFFLAGICYYKLSQHQGSKLTFAYLAIALISTIATHSLKHFIIFSGFFALFYLLINKRLTALNKKPLIFIGGISYSLYLVHQNIGYVIINYAYALDLSPYIGIACAISISFALAYGLTLYIERPALKLIRTTYKNRKDKAAEQVTSAD